MRNIALQGAVFLFATFALASPALADCGKADKVAGEVKIKRVNGGESLLKSGDTVCQGDTVTTAAKDAFATIHMPGDEGKKPNVLRITENSSMKIEAYKHDGPKKKVLLNVLYGKMRATVNSKYDPDKKDNPQQFQVKTKSAVAGVRGTDFLTSFQKGKMQVTTFEGRVEVGKPGPGGSILGAVQVGAGYRTETSGGQVAPPKAVPSSELKELDSSTQAPPAAADAGSSSGQPSGGGDSKDKDDNTSDNDNGSGNDKNKQAKGDGAKESNEGSGGDKSTKGGDKNSGSDGGGGGGGGGAVAGGGSGGDAGGKSENADSGKGGSKGGGNQAGGGGPDKRPERSPSASTPRTVMPIDNADIIGGEKPPMVDPGKHVGATLPVFNPIKNPIIEPPKPCQICDEAVKSGPARVNVRICLPGEC